MVDNESITLSCEQGIYVLNIQNDKIDTIEKAVDKVREVILCNKNGHYDYTRYAININNNLFIAHTVKGGYLHFIIKNQYCKVGKNRKISIDHNIDKRRMVLVLEELKEDTETLYKNGIYKGVSLNG